MPESLKSILGNETIRRVTLLKKLVCSRDLSTNVPFSLDDGEYYLNPLQNPEIKKYKSVIEEYFKRYTSEIKMQVLDNKASPAELIKDYLSKIPEEVVKKDTLLAHWLYNLTEITSEDSKTKLESIIEPRTQPVAELLLQQIKRISVWF